MGYFGESPEQESIFEASTEALDEWVQHFRKRDLHTLPHRLNELNLFVRVFGCAFDDSRDEVCVGIERVVSEAESRLEAAGAAVVKSQRRPVPAKPAPRDRFLARREALRNEVIRLKMVLEVIYALAQRFGHSVPRGDIRVNAQ